MNRKFQKECESSCEYILPDYLGDVKKLLTTSARAIPSGQFNSESASDCSGIVAYEVVYLDSENKLSSASFTSDYDFSFPTDSESYIDSYVTTAVSNFSIRLTGPRRMLAKANLSSDVTVMEKWEPVVTGTAFEAMYTPEKISKTVNIENSIWGDGGEREYAEEAASLEGVNADDIEVITSNAVVRITESVPVDGGVNIRGVLVVTAIIRTPEQSVFAIRREIPFDETVSIDGATPDMSAVSEAVVTSVTCGISESENAACITANVIMELKSLLSYNESVSVVSDAYLKTRDTEAKYEKLSYSEHLAALTREGSVSVKLGRGEIAMENTKEILGLSCEFKSMSLENDGYDPKITGEAVFSGVSCEINEDGTEFISPVKFTAPFSVNVNLNCQIPENAKISVKLSPASCEWNIDNENFYVKCAFSITASVNSEKCENVLSSCDVVGDTEYSKSLSKISVYYPESNETLFEVAKKFHTSVAELAVDNDISEAVSANGELACGFKKLIIR